LADNLTTALQLAGAKTTSGTRSVYDLNGVVAGPIERDALWFMTAHRRWGRRERVANLFHDTVLNDPSFTPADGTNGRPFEPGEPRQISVQLRHLQSLQQQRHPMGHQHLWTELAVADLHLGCAIDQVRNPVRLLNES